MLFKIGLIKKIDKGTSIRLLLNVESKTVGDAIRQALKLAKKHDAELEFIDQLVEGHTDVPMEELLKKIVNSEFKSKGGIYG